MTRHCHDRPPGRSSRCSATSSTSNSPPRRCRRSTTRSRARRRRRRRREERACGGACGGRHRARRHGDAGARAGARSAGRARQQSSALSWRWVRPTDSCAAQAVVDTGGPITVPVGEGTLGRIFNVLGKTIDCDAPVKAAAYWPIHRDPPDFRAQDPTPKIFETGIKVIDLMAPYTRGGKVGLFGGAGVGKTVLIQELIRNIAPCTRASRCSPASASGRAKATTSGSR